MRRFLSENILPNEVDLSGFNLQKNLNSEIWNNEKLNPTVRKALLELALEFIKDSQLPIVNDVIFTGSLANYNWNPNYSDIDLHIVVDFRTLCKDPVIARAYCDEKKQNWNTAHNNIKIMKYPVEVYVQDLHEPHKSTGVYSILKDEWLTKPSLDKLPDTSNKPHIKYGVAAYCNMIDELVDAYSTAVDKAKVEEIYNLSNKLFDAIKAERKESLASAKYGELTTGNILFKTLRRNNYLEKLLTLRKNCFDALHTI